MTVPYHHQVATSKPHLIFKLLFRWRGSVWKAVSLECAVWILLYFIIYALYRFALPSNSQQSLEDFIRFCQKSLDFIPLNFMLSIALFTSQYVQGADDRGRMFRRTIVRYSCLAQALLFRDVSMKVRRRFPTLDALVAGGFMMKHELEKFNDVRNRYHKFWVPLNWALTLLNQAKMEGKVTSHVNEFAVAQEIRNLRNNLAVIWQHDWVSIPILYPQVVFTATYMYFILALFGRQFIISKDQLAGEVDLHFPIVTTLQFVFYIGWMKVAMALLNPFGEDDDDYDCNFLLDRNLTLSLGCQDESHIFPEMRHDVFWDVGQAEPLYSLQSTIRKFNFFMGSARMEEEERKAKEETEEITMVPHPMNKRMEHLRRRRNVTVLSTPIEEKSSRAGSVMSQILNVFPLTPSRSRATTANSISSKDV